MRSSTDLWTFRHDAGLVTDLSGFEVEASDGTVGEIEASTHDAGASYIVVHSGRRIFGHRALVPAGAVEGIDLDTETVFVSVTRDEIDQAPAFDQYRAGDESYRAAIADYYLTQPELEALIDAPTAYRLG